MNAEPLQKHIQGVLGASKSQPHLATLVSAQDPDYVDFMFGTECLASYHKDDLSTRNALIAMLCSAGVRVSDVARVFSVDPRQAGRYAKKMEAEGLAGVAAGKRGRPAVITPEVEAFIRAEFRELYSRRKTGFRDELCRRVKREFGVSVGYERLRQITKPVRDELKRGESGTEPQGRDEVQESGGTEPVAGLAEEEGPEGTATDLKDGGERGEVGGEEERSSEACGGEERLEIGEEGSASQARLRKGFRTRYAGGLLLNVFLRKLLVGTTEGLEKRSRRLFVYFASMVMHMVQFRCVNLERAKGLVSREFGVLIGLDKSPVLRTLRRWLAKLARAVRAGTLQAVLAKNYLKHMVHEKEVFYIDGHFGPYTGGAPFLLGYYPQVRFWVRGRTHYVLCDSQGLPVLFELRDESDDLRQAIPRLIRRTQKLVGGNGKKCFVFDRGAYHRELYASFDDELDAYYVTWEKHDKTDYSGYEVEWEEFEVELQGNEESKPKRKRFWVADCPDHVCVSARGEKSPIRHHRKILLRGELRGRDGTVKGHRIAAFLSNDPDRTNEELARLLLRRWLQENGFKSLSHEFGLDEITSYVTVTYGPELEEVDPDGFAAVAEREIDNPRRRKLDGTCGKLRKRVDTLAGRLARLRRKGSRSKGSRQVEKVEKELAKTRVELEDAEAQRATEPIRINQLEYLASEGYERPDFSRKLLMDLLKVCACNARAQATEVLKKYYRNRRDHVTFLRRMLMAGGHVRLDAKGVLRVRLERLNGEAEDGVFEQFIADINRRKPRTLGPKTYAIRFELAPES